MTIFEGHQSAGILVLNQPGGVVNEQYHDQHPGDFNSIGVVLDSSFRSGLQRGANVEVALYGSNCEVTILGDYEITSKLLNGTLVMKGSYNGMVMKRGSAGFSVLRLTNGIIEDGNHGGER